jgi:hypothetical protein
MFRIGIFFAFLMACSTSASAQDSGSLFLNVMHNCYLSTNDNGEISCDAQASAGSRWEMAPEDDGQYSSFYNLKHACMLAMGRNRQDSSMLSCYFDGSEQDAAYKFDLKERGNVFTIYNVRRECGVYANTRDNAECLPLESSSDQEWEILF